MVPEATSAPPVRSTLVDLLEPSVVRRGEGGEGRDVYRVTIAASEKVRQPPDLDFSGLATENYLKNPVVMWAHDLAARSPAGGLPIGRTLDLRKTAEGRLVVDFEFLDADPFAQRVRNAWDRGFLRAASISWLPLETGPAQGGRWRDTKSDLLEWSIVSVPADPDALRQAHQRMVDYILSETPGSATPTRRGRAAPTRQGSDGALGPTILSHADRARLAEAARLVRAVTEPGAGPDAGTAAAPDGNGAQGGPSEDELRTVRQMVESILETLSSKEGER